MYRIDMQPTDGRLAAAEYEAEDTDLAGSAEMAPLTLASGDAAVTGVGGELGNANALTFTVSADRSGTHAMRVRCSNLEQLKVRHCNPGPLARHADVSVKGAEPRQVFFPHSFRQDEFWWLTVPVELRRGANSIAFHVEDLPNFDGETYASETWPGMLMRSLYAPLIDKIALASFEGCGSRP